MAADRNEATNHSAMLHGGRNMATKLIRLQARISTLMIVLFGVFLGVAALYTAIAGAVIGLIPNIVFAAIAFRHGGARAAPQVVNNFYAGEATKMALTLILFVLAFIVLNGPWFPLFAVFIAITLTHWLAPILHFKSN